VRALGHALRFLLAATVCGCWLGGPASPARADMIDMTGVEPWHMCGSCHGLDGSGNRVKFPRLAGQSRAYILKQIGDFRDGRRQNDGGQMLEAATELNEADMGRVAEWFAKQTAPWPELTDAPPSDLSRARELATKGVDGIPACVSCHSTAAPALAGSETVAPRIAGQRDFYIAKQLTEFRAGDRDNDANETMRAIAKRLSDTDIAALAAFLSQTPALHEATP
jgi:cytochrome c553